MEFSLWASGATHIYRLGWRVRLNLVAVRGGRGASVVREYKLGAARLGRHSAVFSIRTGEEGVYRLSLTVLSRARRRIGGVSQYVVVRQAINAGRLVLGDEPVHAGGRVFFRMENRGSTDMTYDRGYWLLQRQPSGRWKDVAPNRWNGLRGVPLAPGEAASCEAVEVPSMPLAAEYRLRRQVEFFSGKRMWMGATFKVGGPALPGGPT